MKKMIYETPLMSLETMAVEDVLTASVLDLDKKTADILWGEWN